LTDITSELEIIQKPLLAEAMH